MSLKADVNKVKAELIDEINAVEERLHDDIFSLEERLANLEKAAAAKVESAVAAVEADAKKL